MAKRTHRLCKLKAGNGKSQSKGTGRREEGRGNAECGIGSESRTTNHESRTTQKITGRTKPFCRKSKAGKGKERSTKDERGGNGEQGKVAKSKRPKSKVPMVTAGAIVNEG